MLSIAELCRQNLTMIKGLARIDQLLTLSSSVAGTNPSIPISLIDQSLDQAETILKDRNNVLNELITVWYKDWLPLVAEANGRKYLHQVDDVKDHEPIRTVDLSYLVYRQLHYPMEKWARETLKVRNIFAIQNKLPVRKNELAWSRVE